MQACGISQFIFSFTNVMTEELSNHELHDVEGDLLTISGGCGSSAVANVSQHMFTPIGSLHAVVHSDVSLQMSCRDHSAATWSYSCQVWYMTHAGLWHIAVYIFFYQCDD